jgi:hypothetical protein
MLAAERSVASAAVDTFTDVSSVESEGYEV